MICLLPVKKVIDEEEIYFGTGKILPTFLWTSKMDHKIIIDAIGKHLDFLESNIFWIIVIAIAVAWAGVQRKKEIEILSLKFNRQNAFIAASMLYLLSNMAILILFLRIGNLIQLLDQKHFLTGFTRLSTHPWILNPFSYFGNSSSAQFHSGEGFGLLIVIWWLCNSSLYSLMDDKKNKYAYIFLVLFLIVGLGSIIAIQHTYQVVLNQLQIVNHSLYKEVLVSNTVRMIGTFLGIAVGSLLFIVINVTQQRRLKKTGDIA